MGSFDVEAGRRNWWERRYALVEIGGFRSRFGRRGSDFGDGEDILAAILVKKFGYTIALVPQTKVVHMVDSNRFNLDHIRKTILAPKKTRYR